MHSRSGSPNLAPELATSQYTDGLDVGSILAWGQNLVFKPTRLGARPCRVYSERMLTFRRRFRLSHLRVRKVSMRHDIRTDPRLHRSSARYGFGDRVRFSLLQMQKITTSLRQGLGTSLAKRPLHVRA
jgi:hypothetical protein